MKELIEQERLQLTTPTTYLVDGEKVFEPDELAVPRVRQRDLQRIAEAERLEATSRSHRCKTWQVVQMSFADHNLKEHSEIITLLHYLRDYIVHKCGGFYMQPRSIGGFRYDTWKPSHRCRIGVMQ